MLRVPRFGGFGAELPPAEEEKALSEVHGLFERARRASAEREEQARQKEVEAAERAERERVAASSALKAALEWALAAAGRHASEVSDLAGRHASEVEELRAKLAEAEAKAERTKSLAQLTRPGTST